MWESERIRLRAVEPKDLDLMYEVENDSTLWIYGSQNVPFSRHALSKFIEHSQYNIFQDEQLRLAVELTESGTTVGFVDLQNLDARNSRAEVGIAISAAYRNLGIGKECLSLLCEYTRDYLNIHQLYAIVSATNTISTRLFAAAGFDIRVELKEWLKTRDGYADAILFQKILD